MPTFFIRISTALKQTLSTKYPRVSLKMPAFGMIVTFIFFPPSLLVQNDFPKGSSNLIPTIPVSFLSFKKGYFTC